MRSLYSLGIKSYRNAIQVASMFNDKAALWVDGRKNLLLKIEEDLKSEEADIIWIHSASLGEFEQARPLIELLKEKQKDLKILVTFFSPSGYEIRKNYPLADYVYYLPSDTNSNARKFIELVQPKMAVFVKYEYWYNYMNELALNKTPLIFISSIFRPSQAFFKPYGSWFRKHLQQVAHFFVQNEESRKLIEELGIEEVTITGDTRFDRVAQIAEKVESNELVEQFKNGQSLFLGGSTWPEDEKILSQLALDYPKMKFIIAPHLIDETHIEQIEKLFSNAIRYSKTKSQNLKAYQVMIIDNMGMLSSLYQYANYAMIGGGFGVGIHNTLEAATFGMPIFIGPNYHKFQEAKDLKELGAIHVIENTEELNQKLIPYQNNEQTRLEVSELASNYVIKNKGATDKIFQFIQETLAKS